MLPYMMVLPGVIIFTLFVVVPFIIGIFISFNNWDGLSDMKWIGLKNYYFIFKDKIFWKAMTNTVVYAAISTTLKNIFGLALALLLMKNFVGKTTFRVAVYMPVTFSYVVIGVLWGWIFNPNFGILNNFLSFMNVEFLIRGWLSDPKIVLLSVIWVDVWKWSGFHMILYLAGLQSIPKELYESASIDGANGLRQFIHITLPQLNSTIVINFLLAITGAFIANYDIVDIMTKGGPFHSSEVALTYITTTAFKFNSLGKASAMSMILFLVVLVFGIFQVKSMSGDKNYDS